MFALMGHEDRCHATFTQEPLDVVPVGQRLGDGFLEHCSCVGHHVAFQDLLSQLVGLEHGVELGPKSDVVSARLIQPLSPCLLGQLEGLVEDTRRAGSSVDRYSLRRGTPCRARRGP